MSKSLHTVEDVAEEIVQDIGDVLSEERLIARSRDKKQKYVMLLVRNAAVAIAGILFLFSLFHIPSASLCKAVAYFLGAGAYCSEILLVTDCFHTRVPHSEMFMAYCFGPLYILLGISYLLGH